MSIYIWIIFGTAALVFATGKFVNDDPLALLGAAAIGAITYIVVWFNKKKRVSK